MNQNDYVAKLRKRFSKTKDDLSVRGKDIVSLTLKNMCSEMQFGFSCSRQTDFSEENLKKDMKFFECIQKHISELDMELRNLETELSIDELD